MSYTPTNWVTGDVVTAEKLNKIEQGIAGSSTGGGAFVVTFTAEYDNGSYTNVETDHTYAETKAAIEAGQTVIFQQLDGEEVCAQAYAAMFEGFIYAVNFDLNLEDSLMFGTRYYLPALEMEADPAIVDFNLNFVA